MGPVLTSGLGQRIDRQSQGYFRFFVVEHGNLIGQADTPARSFRLGEGDFQQITFRIVGYLDHRYHL